jgi:FtsH-binding integral membrane protein
VTDASAFTTAAICFAGMGVATGTTLRVLHQNASAPMLALVGVSGMLQIVACTLWRNWFEVFEGLVLAALILGLLAWDAGRRK